LRDDLRVAAREVRETCLAFRVRRLNRRVTRIYDAALRPRGLTIAQFNMLIALGLGLARRSNAAGVATGATRRGRRDWRGPHRHYQHIAHPGTCGKTRVGL
jgi:hypothetical protein